MRVLILSHAYLEPESRKNIRSLALFTDVLCVLPDRGGVLLFSNCKFEMQDEDSDLFVPLFPMKLFGSQYLLKGLPAVFKEWQPDIVLIEYNPWSAIFLQCLIAVKLYSHQSKLICSIKKNTYRKTGLSRVKHVVACLMMPHVDFVMSASQMAAQMIRDLLGVPGEKVAVCHPLGVDTSRFFPRQVTQEDAASRAFVIGYCGRFDREKGLTDLIEAVKQLRNVCDREIVLKLMGQGGYRDKLDSYIQDMSRQFSWLITLEPVRNSEVVFFLQSLDLYVLPARRCEDHEEHDAHALLEAMSCGVPCVGTRSGIIPEVLEGCGILVEPERPSEMMEALRILIASDNQLRKLGQLSRAKAEREFDLHIIAKKKVSLFEGIVNESSK